VLKPRLYQINSGDQGTECFAVTVWDFSDFNFITVSHVPISISLGIAFSTFTFYFIIKSAKNTPGRTARSHNVIPRLA